VAQVSSRKHQAFAVKAANELRTKTQAIAARLAQQRSKAGKRDPAAPLAAAEAYTELFRGQLTRLAKLLRPGEEASFDALTSPVEMSRRLQLDLWVFAQLCRAVEGVFQSPDADRSEAALAALRTCIGEFEGVSYQLLRYGDIEPFDRFIAIISEHATVPKGPVARARLGEDCRLFAQVAQSVFAAVSRRAELKNSPFNQRGGRALLARYWAP
jgi:hypothetical protein